MTGRKSTLAPLEILGRWLEEAEDTRAPAPRAMTLVTATTVPPRRPGRLGRPPQPLGMLLPQRFQHDDRALEAGGEVRHALDRAKPRRRELPPPCAVSEVPLTRHNPNQVARVDAQPVSLAR